MDSTDVDRDLLCLLIQDKNVEHVKCPKTKHRLQNEIAEKYNKEKGRDSSHTNKTLSKSWSNLKCKARRLKVQFIKELKATGGGPQPEPIPEIYELVLKIAGDSVEITTSYDSEAQIEEELRRNRNAANTNQVII